jgi:cysteinyl-tRNA synthetase
MSKSAGTFYVLHDIVEKGFDPLDFRYFSLQAHYRYPQNFSWEAMEAAREARLLIKEQVTKWQSEKETSINSAVVDEYKLRFVTFLANDINVPGAIGILWEVVKSTTLNATEKLLLVEDFDQVFGLNLLEKSEFSAEVYDLIAERDSAKSSKDFARADEIRNRLTELGVRIIDTPTGTVPVKA